MGLRPGANVVEDITRIDVRLRAWTPASRRAPTPPSAGETPGVVAITTGMSASALARADRSDRSAPALGLSPNKALKGFQSRSSSSSKGMSSQLGRPSVEIATVSGRMGNHPERKSEKG
jgi:hypothetical protein